MKIKTNNYYQPTPKKWRKLGDSILVFCSFVTGYAVIEEVKWLAIGFIILGGLGKAVSNFFIDD